MSDFSKIELADFGQEEERDEFAAQPVIFNARTINPEIRAKSLSIQKETNLPIETIEADLKRYEQDQAFNSLSLADYADLPVTYRGLADPVTAPLYMDDVQNLSAWEKFFSGVSKSWRAGKRNVQLKEINGRKFWGTATAEDLQIEKALDTESQSYKTGGGFENYFAQIPAKVAEMAPLYLSALGESYDETAAGGAAGVAALGPAGGGAGLLLGAGYGTIIEMGKAEAYLAYKDLSNLKDVTGKPIDDDAARGAAAVVGLLNGALELTGAKLTLKLTGAGRFVSAISRGKLKALMKVPAVADTFAGIGRALGGSMVSEGMVEGLQEGVNLLVGEQLAAGLNSSKHLVALTDQESVKGQIAEAAKSGSQVGIAFAAPKAAMIGVAEHARNSTANRNAELAAELGGLVENSKTYARLPDKLREHIKSIKEEYGVTEDVSVPLDVLKTYFQEENIPNAQIEKEMPQVAAALREAGKTGADVPIAIETFAEYFARSENFKQHLQDVRMHPELPTDREMSELREQVQLAYSAMPQKDNTVFEAFRTKLEQTESTGVADFQARLLASYFETQAAELGISAKELYEQYQVDIERSDLSDLQTEELIAMVQEGKAPQDSEVFGPSLQEFIATYGDTPTTREEAINRGYFDTNDPQEVSKNLFDQTLQKEEPQYAYGQENTALLQTKKKLESLQKEAESLGIDISQGSPAEIAKQLSGNRLEQSQEIQDFKPVDTNSKEFKEWFKGSKIVDENGKPLKVFHGTDRDFYSFNTIDDYGTTGTHFGTADQANNTATIASSEKRGTKPRIIPAYLNISNPIRLTDDEAQTPKRMADALVKKGLIEKDLADYNIQEKKIDKIRIVNQLNAIGFDGIVYENEAEGKGDSYIAFSPTQIKSALSNTGEFSDTDPRILHQETPQGPRGFISMNRARDYFKITLTGSADLSTFLHESGHLFLELTNDLASKANAAPRIVRDMQIIRDWLGVKPGEAFTTEHHEKFARGFEAYLLEGNAPDLELKSAFVRFKSWLASIYKEMRQLNVEFDDRIRGAMDRLIASDEAIRLSASMERVTPIFDNAELAGMSTEDFADYQAAYSMGMVEAEEAMFEKLHGEIKAQHSKAAKQIRAEIEKEVQSRAVYQALHFLRKGQLFDGSEPPSDLGKMDRRIVETMYPNLKVTDKLRGLTVKEGGVHPVMISSYFGFASIDEMIQALSEAPAFKDVVKAETEARVKAIFGDSLTGDGMAKLAREFLHNDNITQMLTRELRTLGNKANKPIPQGFINAARIAAEDQINNTQVGRLQPHRFHQAEQRYGKIAYDAASKNDWGAAAEAKRLQILNHWLFRKATAAKEEADKIRNYLGKFEKIEKRKKLGLAGGQYLESIDALLEGVQISNVPLSRLERRKSLESYLKMMENDGQIVQIPEELRSEVALKNYKSMTVEQFRALRDAVKNIDHLARLKNKLMLAADKRGFRETMNDLVTGIYSKADSVIKMKKQNPTAWEKAKSRMRGFDADLLKIEFLLEQLDGDIAGASHHLIFAPMAEAQVKKYDILRDINKRLYDPLRKMNKGQKARMAAEYNFHGTTMKGHEVLAVALNMGNEGNLYKLMRGYESRGYTEESLIAELDRILTKEDWDLVQHIWDEINTFWPMIAELNKKYTGLEPPKVEPRKVVTSHGEYEGGYYPVVYDPNRKHRAFQNAQKGNDLFENNFMRPNVSSGFTEGRTEYAAPILLSLDALPNHLNEVIHYITHYEAVTQASRIIEDQEFRQAVSETMGPEYYKQLKPWLQAIAQDGKVDDTATWIEGFAKHLTMGVSIMAMGFSTSTAMVQLLGLSSSASRLGPKWLASGLKGAVIPAQRSFALEKSNELRHTMMTFDRDARASYNEMLAMLSGSPLDQAKLKHAQLANFAFYTMGLLQQQVNIATWLGAYNKACNEGRGDAVQVADATVRKTQSGGGMKDLAKIQRFGPIRKMFTAFYTYFSALYGQLRLAGQRMKTDKLVASAQLASLVLLPVLVEKMVRDGLPDDDEPADEWMKSYASGVASFGLATLPIARDVIQPLFTQYGYSMSPGASVIERGLASFEQAVQNDGDMTASQAKNMARLVGLAAHLPATQIIRTWEYLEAFNDGEVEEPIREFIFGVKK